jgi:hypothetical protein
MVASLEKLLQLCIFSKLVRMSKCAKNSGGGGIIEEMYNAVQNIMAAMRALSLINQRHKMYTNQLKELGYSEEEILKNGQRRLQPCP